MTNIVPKPGDSVASTYNASLPLEQPSGAKMRSVQPPNTLQTHAPVQKVQIECLKKELDSRDSTISELKSQLKNLQTIVEQLTKENSVLKTTSSFDDNHSIISHSSTSILDSAASNGLENASKPQERGKSLETEEMVRSTEEELKQSVKGQRPVSMFETREGPKNNWQVTKHQVLIY